jgi:hypothetical protein
MPFWGIEWALDLFDLGDVCCQTYHPLCFTVLAIQEFPPRHEPMCALIFRNEAEFLRKQRMVLLCGLDRLRYSLAVVRVDVIIEFFGLGMIKLGGNADDAQVTEPGASLTHEIRFPSHGLARFHRHAEPVAIAD